MPMPRPTKFTSPVSAVSPSKSKNFDLEGKTELKKVKKRKKKKKKKRKQEKFSEGSRTLGCSCSYSCSSSSSSSRAAEFYSDNASESTAVSLTSGSTIVTSPFRTPCAYGRSGRWHTNRSGETNGGETNGCEVCSMCTSSHWSEDPDNGDGDRDDDCYDSSHYGCGDDSASRSVCSDDFSGSMSVYSRCSSRCAHMFQYDHGTWTVGSNEHDTTLPFEFFGESSSSSGISGKVIGTVSPSMKMCQILLAVRALSLLQVGMHACNACTILPRALLHPASVRA